MKGTAGHQDRQPTELKAPLVELGDLMSKLEHMDKKLKCSEEDRQELKKETATSQKGESGQLLQLSKRH